VLVLAMASFRLAGQYRVHRMRRFREELVGVLKGSGLLALFVMAARFYRQDTYESRTTMALFTAFTPILVLAARRISWATLKGLRRRGYNQTNALIVGTGRVARDTARALRRANWMGIRTLGFIEDQPNRWCSDLPIVGTTADLRRL